MPLNFPVVMAMFLYLLGSIHRGADTLKVIPVIDILNGVVVHAVKGERSEYQPLQSSLTKSVKPVEIANEFKKIGFRDLYVADLDAIMGYSTNFLILKQIVDETCLKLMVDAGLTGFEGAQKLLDSGVSKIIIGTETLRDKNFVSEAVDFFGSERVMVSLDLKDDKILCKLEIDCYKSPLSFFWSLKDMGVSQVIILDLRKVGSSEGVNVNFLKKVIKKNEVDVYVGGGIRGINDLVELKNLGLSGALVATALHTGKIPIDALRQEGFL
jgi:phosphoribosylformimino-5-aminoimidazole carboxamide ribotide isomerase